MNFENYVFLFAVSPMVTWLFSMLLFTRTSMKYIEKALLKQGIGTPRWDQRGWGFRIVLFAALIARGKPSKPSKPQVLADEEILKLVRPYDRILAKVVHYSFILFMIFGFLYYFLYSP